MNLDVDTSLGVLKAALLEVAWVLTDAFAPSGFAKTVPTSEMVLLCWGYFEVEDFHSEFVVSMVVIVKIVNVIEICFFARFWKYY